MEVCDWRWPLCLLRRTQSAQVEVDQVLQGSVLAKSGAQWRSALQGPLNEQSSMALFGRVAWREALTLATDALSYQAAMDCGWELARGLLSTMAGLRMRSDCLGLCSALSQGQPWLRALELLARAQREGLEANTWMLSAAQAACGKGRAWMQPLRLLLTPVTCAAVGSRPWRLQLQGLGQLRSLGFEEAVYGDAETGAGRGWQQMLQVGLVAAAEESGSALNSVCRSWVLLKRWDHALHLLRYDFSPTCFTSLVSACEHVSNELLLVRLLDFVVDVSLKGLNES